MERIWRPTLAVIAAVAAVWLLLGGARAQGGVPIPAQAGTTWEIVAGYNTGTHNWNDQQDPHAIDLVRADAETAESLVLSPTTGTVSYVSNDCLAIRDAAAMEHLLCHIQPMQGLQRAVQVAVGKPLGWVWAAGFGNNGGLAHIHYAVHHSRGGGYMGETVPFVGVYAIEGVELLYGLGANLHAGASFTSTNGLNWQPPATTTTISADDQEDDSSAVEAGDDGTADGGSTAVDDEAGDGGSGAAAATEEDDAHDHTHDTHTATTSTAQRAAAHTVTGGWRMLAVDRVTTIGALWHRRGATLVSMFHWDRLDQRWRHYSPTLPGGSHAGSVALAPGDAVLGIVQDGAAWLPRIIRAAEPPSPQLRTGWNLVSWHGDDASPASAFAGLDSLLTAVLWDNEHQRYLRWRPGVDGTANTIETVPAGSSLWLEVAQPETWVQLR